MLAALPRLFLVEILKLRRSLVLLLCAAAPMLVALLMLMMMLRWDVPRPWDRFTFSGAGLWAYFMLPMTVTALGVLLSQLEHGPRAWNHLLALPVPRWQIFLSKALVIVALVGVMSGMLFLLLPLMGVLGERLKGGDWLVGQIPWRATGALLSKMFAGSILLVAVQLWVALRFRSFVPPLVLGIGGTFVAVAATSAEEGAFFPWLIPTNALATDAARGAMAIDLGLYGGIAALAAMVILMSRAEAR